MRDRYQAKRIAKRIVAETTLAIPPGAERLPDNDQWTNRFEIKSESSNRVYIIAQHKSKGHWGCSCPGWRTRRKCKHLTALGLPALEVPHQVTIASRLLRAQTIPDDGYADGGEPYTDDEMDMSEPGKCKDCGISSDGLESGESLTPDGFCSYCDKDRQWGAGDQHCSVCDGPWRRGRCMGSCPPVENPSGPGYSV